MTEAEQHVYEIAAKAIGHLAAAATIYSHDKGLEAHRKLGEKLWNLAIKADDLIKASFPDEDDIEVTTP